MKIATVLGTRPEIIRLIADVAKLDSLAIACARPYWPEFRSARCRRCFFEELGLRAPDHYPRRRGEPPAAQIGQILERSSASCSTTGRTGCSILGDTNSALCAIIAKRMGIPVFHMEAGNRCFDDRVPEEVNRRVIDHSLRRPAALHRTSPRNLLREGFAGRRVYVTGNPIREVIERYHDHIEQFRCPRSARA